MTHSPSLASLIRAKSAKLGAVFAGLARCHVSIGQPHRHEQRDGLFDVRITLHVPGGELVVERCQHEDVRRALYEAFDEARQQLAEYAQKVRRQVKHHASSQTASGKQSGE